MAKLTVCDLCGKTPADRAYLRWGMRKVIQHRAVGDYCEECVKKLLEFLSNAERLKEAMQG